MSLEVLQTQFHLGPSTPQAVVPALRVTAHKMHCVQTQDQSAANSLPVYIEFQHDKKNFENPGASVTHLQFDQEGLLGFAKHIIRELDPHFENRELSVLNEIRDRLVSAPARQSFSAPEKNQ